MGMGCLPRPYDSFLFARWYRITSYRIEEICQSIRALQMGGKLEGGPSLAFRRSI